MLPGRASIYEICSPVSPSLFFKLLLYFTINKGVLEQPHGKRYLYFLKRILLSCQKTGTDIPCRPFRSDIKNHAPSSSSSSSAASTDSRISSLTVRSSLRKRISERERMRWAICDVRPMRIFWAGSYFFQSAPFRARMF